MASDRLVPRRKAPPGSRLVLNPVTSLATIRAAVAAKVEDQVRLDAASLDPTKVEEVVQLVLKYGPSIYQVITTVFHLTPKV